VTLRNGHGGICSFLDNVVVLVLGYGVGWYLYAR